MATGKLLKLNTFTEYLVRFYLEELGQSNGEMYVATVMCPALDTVNIWFWHVSS